MAAFARIPVVAEIGKDLQLTSLGVGALASTFALGRVVTDLPAGLLTDRAKPGAMMGVAGLLVAAGSLMLGLAPSALLAFVGVFVAGAGSAWTLTTSMAFFARAPRQRRGKSLSYMAGSLLTAQAVGPAFGGAVADLYDWRLALVLAAVIALVTVLPFLRAPGPPPDQDTDDDGGGDDRASRRVLAVLYLLPAVQFSIGAAVIQTLVPLIADQTLEISVAVVGLAVGLGGLARFVGAIAAGQVSDRVGRRAALLPGLAIQLAGLVVLASNPSLSSWWLAILLVSLGSISVNVGTTMLADLSGRGLGRRLGVFRLTGDSAFVVAPLLAGYLFERHGQTWSVLPTLGLTAAVLVAAALWLPETRR